MITMFQFDFVKYNKLTILYILCLVGMAIVSLSVILSINACIFDVLYVANILKFRWHDSF